MIIIFIDYAKIYVRAGRGGNGCVSFRREKYVPFGGPDGGSGGAGGNIVIESDNNISTLIDFKYKRHFNASSGASGQGKNKTGKTGEDCIIKVPVGTVVKDNADNILADLNEDKLSVIIAEGGVGGKGNAFFATATNQAPKFAENGLPGVEKEIILELKLLADVGIIGFPNAGKSSLLSKISAAKPKIADYPFTTIEPKVGVVKVGETGSFVAADMPGLIEGASDGKGLGHLFLRHIERTKILWHLIEVINVKTIIDRFNKINYELKKYNKELAKKNQIIVISKMDVFSENERKDLDKIIEYFEKSGNVTFCISSMNNLNIKELIFFTYNKLQELKDKIEDKDFKKNYALYELKKSKKDKVQMIAANRYKIIGDKLKNYILKLNFNYQESIIRLHNYLKENNLIDELIKKGVKDDDIVIIEDKEFVFKSDDWTE